MIKLTIGGLQQKYPRHESSFNALSDVFMEAINEIMK